MKHIKTILAVDLDTFLFENQIEKVKVLKTFEENGDLFYKIEYRD